MRCHQLGVDFFIVNQNIAGWLAKTMSTKEFDGSQEISENMSGNLLPLYFLLLNYS